MLVEEPRRKGGGLNGRALACALLATSILATSLIAPPQAAAFEIFGWKFFESDEEEIEVVDPLNYTVTFEVAGGDEDLTDDLRDTSNMVADEEKPVSGSLGLLAKATSERDLLISELYRRARYDGVVDITIDGKPLDTLPPDAEFGAGPVPVVIRIEPGSVFTLGDVVLKGDAADLTPEEFELVRGGDAGSDAILKAEALIVRRLKEEGRPLARVTNREVVADHATTTLDVTIFVEAGPVAGYGETTVEGSELVDPEFTRYMTGLERGETYSPEEMDEARERLANLGVFGSISVTEADALDANGQIPINVEVSDRKQRYFGAGATYSSTEGIGIEGYWGHRNLFGRAEKLRIEGSISRIADTSDYGKLDYNAAIMFEKPGVIGPPSRFFANVSTVLEHPDAYDRFAVIGETGVAYDIDRQQSVSASVKLEYADIDDVFGEARHLIASTPLQYVYDKRNDKLNPTSGWRALVYAEPSYDFLQEASWVKFRTEDSIYFPFDKDGRYVAAFRVAGGSIVGASIEDVPADRRFYAGGGGSVRGYAYQGIGPKDADGQPIGGLSYAEGSVELRIGITEEIGIVPFVDAGTVSEDEYPDFSDIKIGAGLGVRYLTPFGPLRLDAAVPLNPDPGDPDFGIYAGIGQAF
jgi:translocation and assembly module TamA